MSELLRRIDHRLASESDPTNRGVLLARRAIYFARVGRFVEAHEIVALLRSNLSNPGMERVAIWVMLVEGVLDQYEKLGSRAYDRVKRAQVLSLAFRDSPLVAVTSAWRAYLEFEASNFSAAADALTKCFDHVGHEDDDDAAARAAMILTYGFAYCGQRSASQHWFQTARQHALKNGDHAAIEGLMHNRASFGLAWSRIQQCYGRLSRDAVRTNRSEIESAKNFQKLVDLRSLNALTELCLARVLMLEQSFPQAVDSLKRLRDEKDIAIRDFEDGMGALEISYCFAKMGRAADARSEISKIVDFEFRGMEVDDQLVAAWLTSQIAQIDDSLIESPTQAHARLDDRTKDFEVVQRELLASLAAFRPEQQ